jgi:single-strand DNA-binding protein
MLIRFWNAPALRLGSPRFHMDECASRTEWHRRVSFGKLADFAATLKKGAHVQVEGELRCREYEKDGVKHKVFECCLESILKLDRAERHGENEFEGPES